MVVRPTDTNDVRDLFEGWKESCIWSCLEGMMGDIYMTEDKTCAKAIMGDFTYFAGTPCREIIEHKTHYCILVPQNEAWCEMIESVLGDKVYRDVRYAIKKEHGIFDREHLEKAAASLPSGYEFKMIDKEYYHKCLENDWCADFVKQYKSSEFYEKSGLGVLAIKDGEIAAGASSYSSYSGGIEIEIVTHKEHRRRGLAYACGAKLILCCLDRGLYPCWDARTMISVSLAKKLGYHFDHEYPVYIIK